jgi:hypothetical protein
MKRRTPDLIELQENFRAAVYSRFGGLRPCYFRAKDDHCEGRIEAAHWISRQRVKNALWPLLPPLWDCAGPKEADLIWLAEWDPRNAVPACERHHRRFDSHRMPPLVVPRDAVPDAVEEFCADWGLESELGRKCPQQKGNGG